MTAKYELVSGTYDYGSIVRALQAQIAQNLESGQDIQSYPYNYEGITLAIQDLTFQLTDNPGADIGPTPNGGDVTIDENGNPQFSYSQTPNDGDLWFDTRQGRLFIAYESQWYQTNGGDGFPVVTADTSGDPPSASNLVIGQFWYDRHVGILYIFAGQYRDLADGTITTIPSATTVPLWQQLVDTNEVQTTATLPLVPTNIDAKIAEAITQSNFLPDNVDPAQFVHQDDANLYFVDSLLALDTELKVQQVTMSEFPPSSPKEGELWFDITDIEMSIFYIEPGEDYGQWVPIFSTTTIDQEVTTLQRGAIAEANARLGADNVLQAGLDALTQSLASQKTELVGTLNSLQAQITAIPAPADLSDYVTLVKEQTDYTNLQNQITANDGDISILYKSLENVTSDADTIAALQSSVASCATSSELTAVENSIPSLTGYATETYVNSAINANTGITQVGGTLNGTLTIDKTDVGVPTFDYSTNDWDGRLSQKYQTYCNMSMNHYATFGTNNNLYEYAWAFDDNEDFCWNHGTNGKVASIDKSGIAATNFYIATFGANTNDGRSLATTIDVGAHITGQKAALTSLRTAAASATTLDELKTAIANALANL